MKRDALLLVGAAALALGTAACGTVTKLPDVWRSESVEAGSMKRVFVVGVAPTATDRRSFEDSFARALGSRNVEAVPSHTLLPLDDRLSETALRDAIRGQGFDGVIVTRLVGVEEKIRVRRSDHRGYYNSYRTGWDVVHSPTHTRITTIVRLDTQLYDVGTQDPVWSARSETFDPGSVGDAIDSVTAALSKRLTRDDLLPR